MCNNKNTKKQGVIFKVGGWVFIFSAFLCCSLIKNRPAMSTANWTRCHGVTECVADCCGRMCNVLFCCGSLKNLVCILLWKLLMLEKIIYWIKPPQRGNETCLFISVCKCVFCACKWEYGSARELVKYFMEMQSGDQTMHRIFSQMPETWDSTSLAQLAQTPPQPTIFRLSQWNLPNHTAGG